MARARPVESSKWLVFAIVSIALFMSSLDSTIVATGLPTIHRALRAPIEWVSWTMTAYQLGMVTMMPIAGRLADSLGRKRVFLAAAALFTVASAACGMVSGVGVLIVLRAVQAVGGAAFLPSASGMVADAFGRDRSRALGLFSSIFPLGALAGPVFGGIIIADWSWRGVFLVNAPVGLLFTALAARYLPAGRPRPGRPDVLGAALLGATVLSVMLAITDWGSGRGGILAPACVLPAAAALVCGWWFVHRSAVIAEPLIPLRLLKGRAFVAVNGINFVWGACAIGFGSLVPLFSEERYGLGPLPSGTLLTARALGEIGLAVGAAMLIYRTGYRIPMIVGFGLISGGLLMIASPPEIVGPYAWLAVGATLTGLGTGLSAPAANNASIELAPEDVGAITGLRGAARQGGAIVAVALCTSVMARSGHPVDELGRAFVVLAVLLLAMSPLVFVAPDGRRRPNVAPAALTAAH